MLQYRKEIYQTLQEKKETIKQERLQEQVQKEKLMEEQKKYEQLIKQEKLKLLDKYSDDILQQLPEEVYQKMKSENIIIEK